MGCGWKVERMFVDMHRDQVERGVNDRLNHGTNNDWTDDGPKGWANNDWTNDGANGGTNNNRGLIVSSKFIFENALTVAIGEFKSSSTTISCF
jgi:hypothetical protein